LFFLGLESHIIWRSLCSWSREPYNILYWRAHWNAYAYVKVTTTLHMHPNAFHMHGNVFFIEYVTWFRATGISFTIQYVTKTA
jgi:hypothetical protein